MDESLQKWVKTWKSSASALEKIHIQELRQPDYYERHQHALAGMLRYAVKNAPVRKSSGLVTMQKYFRKVYQQRAKG